MQESADRMAQRDLVLNVNEYAYVLDQTKGNVVCWVGPSKTSLSQSDQLVTFNEVTKRFEPCNSFEKAIKLFTTAPKGWYVVLTNPTTDDKRPTPGTSNHIPEGMRIGKKINIQGPVSFALYPGQMAKVIEGHILRSNQYIMVRIYDAEAANQTLAEGVEPYISGQMMVIKGTEVSFYIPPTGFEIVKEGTSFVQDAVTLEKLEYCILKDENGNKRYVQGPAVVFPEPTESFIKGEDGGYKFRAIELSKISGIYIKVIEDYSEGGKDYRVGDELFITGKDQMIYYPRPEHAIIQYGNKIVHHAIAIPKGEGRYIMNRLTGEIKTVIGPLMLLPDPRVEVVIKRKLSRSQCELWYPGNREVLEYNGQLTDPSQDRVANASYNLISADNLNSAVLTAALNSTSRSVDMLSKSIGVGDAFARSQEFTKPRTITLDTKFDGVVKLDVWTGYAVNIISSDGSRRVVVGPQSVLLDYDETLEVLTLSTGKPKTTDNVERTVFLRCENNQVSDIINLETEDYIPVEVKLSFSVDFDLELKDKWFKVENYVKFLCDRMRSKLKSAVKQLTIAEFYANATAIIKDVIFNAKIDEEGNYTPVTFKDNGMFIKDIEVLTVRIDGKIASTMEAYQRGIIESTLKLASAKQTMGIQEELYSIDVHETELRHAALLRKAELDHEREMEAQLRATEAEDYKAAEARRRKDEEIEIQKLDLAMSEAQRIEGLAREKMKAEALATMNEVDIAREKARTEAVVAAMAAISPDLVQAMQDGNNTRLMESITKSMSPYAIAQGTGVVDVTNQLLRGTPMESALKGLLEKK